MSGTKSSADANLRDIKALEQNPVGAAFGAALALNLAGARSRGACPLQLAGLLLTNALEIYAIMCPDAEERRALIKGLVDQITDQAAIEARAHDAPRTVQ